MEAEPPKASPANRKHRWYQFSLRTLMIFTLICAIGSAWVARKIDKKRKERQAVAAIVKMGGQAVYDSGAHPPGPEWLRTLLGENVFRKIDRVSLHRVTDSELECLEELPDLISLDLEGANITDAGLVHLNGLTQLSYLSLKRTKITDAGLVRLRGLSKLEALRLEGTSVTENGVRPLYSLPNCLVYRDAER